jgi:hypothetical protein
MVVRRIIFDDLAVRHTVEDFIERESVCSGLFVVSDANIVVTDRITNHFDLTPAIRVEATVTLGLYALALLVIPPACLTHNILWERSRHVLFSCYQFWFSRVYGTHHVLVL